MGRRKATAAAVPLIYAAAMGANAVAALASGWAYDRSGAKTPAALPVLSALVPFVAFSDHVGLVVVGALLWGAAVGIQESTLRAVVADLAPSPRRATAYYDTSITGLIVTVVVIQLVAAGLAIAVVARRRGRPQPP